MQQRTITSTPHRVHTREAIGAAACLHRRIHDPLGVDRRGITHGEQDDTFVDHHVTGPSTRVTSPIGIFCQLTLVAHRQCP